MVRMPTANHEEGQKDFKHKKQKLTLVELGSHLRIKESFRAQDSDKPKGNNVVGLQTWVDGILRFMEPVGYGLTTLLLRHFDLDLIGDEDSIDEDGDIGVSVSLGDKIFSKGKESLEINIGDSDNTGNSGKTTGRVIINWGGGIALLISELEGTINREPLPEDILGVTIQRAIKEILGDTTQRDIEEILRDTTQRDIEEIFGDTTQRDIEDFASTYQRDIDEILGYPKRY
ncbi:hypothetical protein Tco_0577792 [Tanacetum coccineum]